MDVEDVHKETLQMMFFNGGVWGNSPIYLLVTHRKNPFLHSKIELYFWMFIDVHPQMINLIRHIIF